MKSTGWRSRLLAVIAMLAMSAMLLPAIALAQGIGGVPSRINLDAVLRESTVFRPFALFHSFEEGTVTFVITFDGDVTPWVSAVLSNDRDTPITEVTLGPRGNADLELRVDMPADVPNGVYEGRLVATTEPRGEEAVNVSAGIIIPLTITVTGTQTIEAAIVAAEFRNAEEGQPARIGVRVRNSGNVSVQPELVARIERDGELIDEVIRDDRIVFPGDDLEIELQWDTTDERTGTYDIIVSGTADELDLGGDTGTLEVFARGEFTRRGHLDALEVTNEPTPGGVARIAATVSNTGGIEARATFVGELFRDGELVGAVQSVERFLRAGDSGVIQIIVDTPEDGVYELKGVANFEGTDSDERSVEFAVGDVSASGASGIGLWLGIGAGVVALFGGVYLFIRGRRRRTPSTKAPEASSPRDDTSPTASATDYTE